MSDLIISPLSVRKGILQEELKTKLRNELNKIPSLNSYRLHNDLILYLCQFVENELHSRTGNHKYKLDKKSIVLNVLQSVFGLSPEEVNVASNMIDFLHSNKQIKPVSAYKFWGSWIWSRVFEKKE